jgi:hypothetical protein
MLYGQNDYLISQDSGKLEPINAARNRQTVIAHLAAGVGYTVAHVSPLGIVGRAAAVQILLHQVPRGCHAFESLLT